MTEEEVEEEEEGAKNQEKEELREGGRFGRKGVMEDIEIERREEAVAVGGGGSGIGGGGVGGGGGVVVVVVFDGVVGVVLVALGPFLFRYLGCKLTDVNCSTIYNV